MACWASSSMIDKWDEMTTATAPGRCLLPMPPATTRAMNCCSALVARSMGEAAAPRWPCTHSLALNPKSAASRRTAARSPF